MNKPAIAMNIHLERIQDVKTFVENVSCFPFKQTLIQGRYRVDAQSILGVMSLDLSKPVLYISDSYDTSLYDGLRTYMAGDQTINYDEVD